MQVNQNTEKEPNTWLLLNKLKTYVWRYKFGLFMAICGMLGYAIVDTFFVYQIKPLIDDGLTKHDAQVLYWIPFVIIFIVFMRGVAHFLSDYFMSWVGTHVVMDLQLDVFKRLIGLPHSFYDKKSTGDIIAKITYDASQVNEAASSSLIALIREGATVIGLLGLMFYQSWKLSLIFLVLGPIVGVAIGIISKKFRRASRGIQGAVGSITSSIEQTLKGRVEILMYGGQKVEEARFTKDSDAVRKNNMRLVRIGAIGSPIVQILGSLGLAILLALATQPQILNEISTGAFTMMVTSLMMLLKPLKNLMQVNNNFQKGVAACQSLFAIMDEPLEKDEGTEVFPEKLTTGLQFNNVSFSYENDIPVLKDISLNLPLGKTMALVGRSGSGKSTIASLIARLYDVKSGTITIDGKNIQEYTLKSLRSNISFVSQNVHIFHDTVANNIAYASNEKYTRDEIIAAAKKAGADEFIVNLSEGYDTVLSEDGGNLSGGQRQRIAIARALLRKTKFLVLDEATSALDNESEKIVKDTLKNLDYECGVIIIAHRLTTIKEVDEIVVLEHGSVLEHGTHDELMSNKSLYYYLNTQDISEKVS